MFVRCAVSDFHREELRDIDLKMYMYGKANKSEEFLDAFSYSVSFLFQSFEIDNSKIQCLQFQTVYFMVAACVYVRLKKCHVYARLCYKSIKHWKLYSGKANQPHTLHFLFNYLTFRHSNESKFRWVDTVGLGDHETEKAILMHIPQNCEHIRKYVKRCN